MVDAPAPGHPGAAAAKWTDLFPYAPHDLDLGGMRLRYVDEGPRQAKPLLLVHGNPTWSFYWRDVIRAFRDERRVVAPDHLGCGRSDKPQSWSYRLADHVANLERLVLDLDLRHTALVVHDWGGPIGLGVASRHPDRFERLVITNTAAFRSTAIPLRIAACRIPGFGALAVRGLNGFARAATVMATERGLEPLVKQGYLAPYGSWADRIGILRFVQDIPLRPSHPSWATLLEVEAGLARLADKPTLLVWGERDWCFTPAFREQFQARFPRAQVRPIAHAGHYVVEDAKDEVLAAIREFVG